MHVPNNTSGAAESIACASTQVLLWLVRIYKLFFSQLFTGSCRFVPSCSSYAEEALIKHGTVRGGWLAVMRLARCHPFCESGLDQVPEPRRPQQH
jgi:putative membrane protein insertion efficiency factor